MKIEIGQKLNLKRDAVVTFGDSEKNPIVTKVIDAIEYTDGYVNYFTFKGGKTKYRLYGSETQPRVYGMGRAQREYKVIL